MIIYRFYNWLKTEIPFRKIPTYILGEVLVNACLSAVGIAILDMVYTTTPLPQILTASDLLWYTPLLLVVNSFFEELFFRGPLYFKKLQNTPSRLYAAILISSVLFGLAHGTFFNIAIQGVSGLLLSILFLKGGGSKKRFWRGIATSTIAHALFDCMFWAVYANSLL